MTLLFLHTHTLALFPCVLGRKKPAVYEVAAKFSSGERNHYLVKNNLGIILIVERQSLEVVLAGFRVRQK